VWDEVALVGVDAARRRRERRERVLPGKQGEMESWGGDEQRREEK